MSTATPPTDDPTLIPLRPAETAPSAVLADVPVLSRSVGVLGLVLFAVGASVVIATKATGQPRYLLSEGWAYIAAAVGVALTLYHAVRDEEPEVRRLYGLFGGVWLLLALAAAVIPGPVFGPPPAGAGKAMGYNLLPWGVGAGLLGLLYLIPFARNETDPTYRSAALFTLLGVGGLLTVGSVAWGVARPDFLAGPGVALAVLGLGFVCAFLGRVDTSEGLGFHVATALGAVGAAALAYAVFRSFAPTMLYEGPNALRRPNGEVDTWRAIGRGLVGLAFLGLGLVGLVRSLPVWARAVAGVAGLAGVGVVLVASFGGTTLTTPRDPFLVPAGVILGGLGVAFLAVALGVVSDNRFVTLTRRELGGFFVSPIGYIVLLGMVASAWIGYVIFLNTLAAMRTAPEPIVQRYAFSVLVSIFAILFFVPALTMRLFAEEKRSGSLEVLLTAPVTEAAVVLSKFVAVWVFFMVSWLPFGLFLVALRVEGGPPGFDYRPLLSFYLALGASGAAFLGMGLFFSSLTKNQVVAAVLTFVGMFLMLITILANQITMLGATGKLLATRFSFYELWEQALGGQFLVRDALMWVSFAVFWLFLTVKSMEARKWA